MLSKNQIKDLQNLRLKKNRDANKLFIAEGLKTVRELLQGAPSQVTMVLAVKGFLQENPIDLPPTAVKVLEVPSETFEKISLQSTPAGILAVCNYFEEPSPTFNFSSGFSLYLDDIRDPGNFGTIIRLADWFGIHTVFCSSQSCDLYNPKVIQSTMGAFMRVKMCYMPLEEVIRLNKPERIYGAVLKGKNIYREELKNGLVVIGNEANGISEVNLRLVNQPITIPAHSQSGTESLNAAMAASIITSEFFRQIKI